MRDINLPINTIKTADFLAGGGGVTTAMRKIPGVSVRFVLNHDQMAIRTNMHNNRGIKHYWADFYRQDEHELEPVDFLWASIECTQHSKANGGREKKIGSYTLGWELIRYLRHLRPAVIGIENVPEFKDWAPIDENNHPIRERKGEEFERWKNAICELGYTYHELICNAADFGIPTRRIRYFAFFTKTALNLQVNWPKPTHNKTGSNGLSKWEPCKHYIDLNREGESIFGREINPNIAKGKRKPLSPNTMKRIAGGIRKFAPELQFIFQYYGNGLNANSLSAPLNTVTVKDRHVLVSCEKTQFVSDHVMTDNYHHVEEPMNPQLTRQTKQLVTVEKQQLLNDYYGRKNTSHSIDCPATTITTENSKNLITIEKKFFSHHFGSGNNQSVDEPMNSITTKEKIQFISAHFNASGKPGSQNQDVDTPLGSITTGTNKKSLITAIANGEIDFDIKMRFLDPEELSRISTFPEGYFTDPLLKLTKKTAIKLIGNAVPPEWARIIIEPVINELRAKLQ